MFTTARILYWNINQSGGCDKYACDVCDCCQDFGDDPKVNCVRGCLIKWDTDICAKLQEPQRSDCRRTAHLDCYDRCLAYLLGFNIPSSCDDAREDIGGFRP